MLLIYFIFIAHKCLVNKNIFDFNKKVWNFTSRFSRWRAPTSLDEEDVILTDGTMNHVRVRLASQQVLVEPLTAILEGLSEIDR